MCLVGLFFKAKYLGDRARKTLFAPAGCHEVAGFSQLFDNSHILGQSWASLLPGLQVDAGKVAL